jgi:hypothetical protein
MKRLVVSLSLAFSLLCLGSCDGGDKTKVPESALSTGGVFLTYVVGCEQGCSELKSWDVITSVDGAAVTKADDVLAKGITDGKPHKLEIARNGGREKLVVDLVANPNTSMPPIKDAPPFWMVGTEELKQAPTWARRRLFAHAMPQVRLMSSDGGDITGREFPGKPHILVAFDWATQSDRLNGGTFLKVLQKAQADLGAAGVEVMFAQVRFESERARPAMNDSDIRKFVNDNQVTEGEGGPLPPPPLYRAPNSTEESPALVVGMEGSFTVSEAIGEAPAVIITDKHGIVRWHSAGLTPDPEDKLQPDVYTINQAVLFALQVVGAGK